MELAVMTTELSYIYIYIYINKGECQQRQCLGAECNIRSCPPISTPSFVFIERNEPTDNIDFMLQMEICYYKREFSKYL
jgi:hypothetical protein